MDLCSLSSSLPLVDGIEVVHPILDFVAWLTGDAFPENQKSKNKISTRRMDSPRKLVLYENGVSMGVFSNPKARALHGFILESSGVCYTRVDQFQKSTRCVLKKGSALKAKQQQLTRRFL